MTLTVREYSKLHVTYKPHVQHGTKYTEVMWSDEVYISVEGSQKATDSRPLLDIPA